MQSKYFIIFIILLLFVSSTAEGQILKKIKKAAEETAENTIFRKKDDVNANNTANNNGESNGENNTVIYEIDNSAKSINTEAKRTIYHTDVVVKTFDKEKQAYTNSYFDADEIAMKANWNDPKTGDAQVMFIDSEGYYITFNDKTQSFEKSNLLSSGAMSMMAPSMMAEAYKLPTGIIWDASEDMKKKGLNFNTFTYVDFVFILKPEHFRNEMYGENYTEIKTACRGEMDCIKFNIKSAGYSNSYILFDSQNRLAEINIVMDDHETFGSGAGKLEFFYEPCEVLLPKAKEVKSPMQDLFKLGLDPAKN